MQIFKLSGEQEALLDEFWKAFYKAFYKEFYYREEFEEVRSALRECWAEAALKSRKLKNRFYQWPSRLIRSLPEEYQGEFNALRQRWHKQKIPQWRISLRSFLCVINLLRIQIQCNIQQIWLSFDRAKN